MAFEAQEAIQMPDHPFYDLPLARRPVVSVFLRALLELFFGVAATRAPQSSSQCLSHSMAVKQPFSARGTPRGGRRL